MSASAELCAYELLCAVESKVKEVGAWHCSAVALLVTADQTPCFMYGLQRTSLRSCVAVLFHRQL